MGLINEVLHKRLGFHIALLVFQKIDCTSPSVPPSGPHYWGFFTFYLHPPHRVRTQILENPLSSTDHSNLLQISGRGHMHNRCRGCEGGGWPSSFFDWRRSSFDEHRRRETLSINTSSMLSSNEEVQSNDEVFSEIEDYFEEAERGEPI